MIIYDKSFNQNEWFIILVLLVSIALIIILPRMELPFILVLNVYGITAGMFFDHTISIDPFNFYDVNDNSNYELFDFISYIMYGPFAYFFVYFYEKFKIKGLLTILYIFLWSIISICLELFALKIGVFHYRREYRLLYSFPIYLFIQSCLVIFYHFIKKNLKTIPS